MSRGSDEMLSTKNIVKALVVSVALTFLLSFGSVVLFSYGMRIDPAVDWEKVNSMPYSEATTYIEANTKPSSGWENLKVYVQWRAFVTPSFFALFGSVFAGCLALLWWVRNENAT
jgi:hypothetical protein